MAKKKISIVDRRRASGSIFGSGSRPIPLKEPERWTIREVNSKQNPQRIYQMTAEKEWVFLDVEDMAVKPEDIGYRTLDGRVVRGEQGELVLMKMEKSDYALIQREKDRLNRAQTLGSKAAKQTIMNAMHAAGDDQGGEFMSRALKNAKIEDATERVPLIGQD